MLTQTPNNKALKRFRRERNLVAKHNKHKGGAHTKSKYQRPRSNTNDLMDEWEDGLI